METKTFEVSLKIYINVPVQDSTDETIEVARKIAFQNVQELRESIPHDTQITKLPKMESEL